MRLHRATTTTSSSAPGDPSRSPRRFAAAGARRIHLVDLDGARSGPRPPRARPRWSPRRSPPRSLQASGGIRSLDDARGAARRRRRPRRRRHRRLPRPGALGRGARRRSSSSRSTSATARCAAAGWTAGARASSLGEAVELCLAAGVDARRSAPRSTATARSPAPTSSSSRRSRPPGLRVLAAGGVRSPADVAALAARRRRGRGRRPRASCDGPVKSRPQRSVDPFAPRCLSCFGGRELPAVATTRGEPMRKLAITLAVSTTLGSPAACAGDASPVNGPFAGKTSRAPDQRLPGPRHLQLGRRRQVAEEVQVRHARLLRPRHLPGRHRSLRRPGEHRRRRLDPGERKGTFKFTTKPTLPEAERARSRPR